MEQERLQADSWQDVHGHAGNSSWAAPILAAKSDKYNRSDQGNTIKANEYLDEPEVLEEKMKLVADLIRKSKCLVAYTGAGLSKASGIPDYASKAADSVVQAPKLRSSLDAQPTYAHFILTGLERAGYLKYYVQQNHDGLPQKSGFPQEKMNEIHGAWQDPSNPVVPFSGSLRGDLFSEMRDMEKKADMCLCLGTSLSGMNADRMASTPALKSLKGVAIGTVLINIQQTRLDSVSTVRVWAKIDDALRILYRELDLGRFIDFKPPQWPSGELFQVPYDENGLLSRTVTTTLDLRQGAQVRICVPGAMNQGAQGVMAGKRADGHWVVQLKEPRETVRRVFGAWWVDAALRGAVSRLPFVNIGVVPVPK